MSVAPPSLPQSKLVTVKGKKKGQSFRREANPISPDGLERTRKEGSPLVPALSGQSQTDKVTVSRADNKFLLCFLASCRADRERESERAGYFFRVVPKRFAYYTWPWP